MDFEEFCAAAISVHQLEGMESREQHACRAYELFEKDGNRPIMIEELASVSFSLSLAYPCIDNAKHPHTDTHSHRNRSSQSETLLQVQLFENS